MTHRARLCLLVTLLTAPLVRAETLTLAIDDIRFPGFTLYLAVYPAGADGWGDDPVLRRKASLPAEEPMTLELDLPPGRYAMRAFVDLNQNGELDTNDRDRPVEPFAISVGEGRERPSLRFSRSVMRVRPDGEPATLTLRYPGDRNGDSTQ